MAETFDIVVVGGGHAGVEAAWAAAGILAGNGSAAVRAPARVALVTLDPSKVGVMSCNPAIGGLAKGQLVREIDALGGVMGLATDAAGINFKVLNSSKGAAVRGPRAQCDKHAYARTVQAFLATRPEIVTIAGSVDELLTEALPGPIGPGEPGRVITGVVIRPASGEDHNAAGARTLLTRAVVLTTGTFMRGLMHTGEQKTTGGRFGEGAAVNISGSLRELGFELGRLKTGTPPRLKRSTIDWDNLEPQLGDEPPVAFSDLTLAGVSEMGLNVEAEFSPVRRFPVLPQVDCRITETTEEIHELIRKNLHRAPMYSGQIESVGPRYCPSLEDKVVRFAQRQSHHVYLEPESLEDDWIYCNGISTSLPADVQEGIVRGLHGCERAEILRYGYAVEYDMVRPHQIRATGETRLVSGLFLAGQINGTSGYEEAAAQGLIAGINAARRAIGQQPITLGRDQAYIGVLMDDLVTKTPVEPYRMFTSRAEHRLALRSDNSADRLTGLAEELGLLGSTTLGRMRLEVFAKRRRERQLLEKRIEQTRVGGQLLSEVLRRPETTTAELAAAIGAKEGEFSPGVLLTAHTEHFYSMYMKKAQAQHERLADLEHKAIPAGFDYLACEHLRSEARQAMHRFRPATMGQALRLEGVTPSDLTLLAVLIRRHLSGERSGQRAAGDAKATGPDA